MNFNSFLSLSIALSFNSVHALTLTSQKVESCSKDGQFVVSSFKIDLDPTNNNLNTLIDAEVRKEIPQASAKITIVAFGSDLQTISINLCQSQLGRNSCPIKAGKVDFKNTQNLPSAVSGIIAKLKDIPALDLSAKIQIVDEQGNDLGCVQIGMGQKSSLMQNSISYTTLGIASVSAGMSLFGSLLSQGTTRAQASLSPSFYDVMSLYQFIGTTGQLSLSYPDIYHSFVSNYGWSMGIIYVPSFERAFSRVTGANKVSANSTAENNLVRRDSTPKNESGIQTYSRILKIDSKNLFLTILVIVLLVFSAMTALSLILRLILDLLSKVKPNLFMNLRNHFVQYYLGMLLRVFIIGYNVIAMAAFYQLTIRDSIGTTVLAIIVLSVFCIVLMLFVTIRIIRAGPTKLYSKPTLQYKYGALYSDYRLPIFAFFVPLLIYQIFRAAIVGLLYNYVWVQMVLIIANEIVMFFALLLLKPYSSRFANGLNVFVWFLRIINLAILFLFVSSIPIKSLAKTIISGILIAIQALLTLSQAIIILFNFGRTIINLLSKKDPKKSDDYISNEDQTNYKEAENTSNLGENTVHPKNTLHNHKNSSTKQLNSMPTF